MSKSMFSKGSSTNNHSLILSNKREKQNSNELILIQNLLKSKFTIDLRNVIKYYYIGNFDKVLELLSKERLAYLSKLLYSYRKSSIEYPTYEQFRLLLNLYLEGLTKSIIQFLELGNIKIALSISEERCKILDNMEKLQEYIDKLNRSVNLFKSTPVSIVEAKISPKYAIYLQMYGYPVGGIFDLNLLNNIKI